MPSLDPVLGILVIGFEGHSLPEDIAALLSRGLGGVALFGRNIADREQVTSLCMAIREASAGLPPPIIAVDEEGGRVQRLRHICPRIPAMREVGREGVSAASAFGRAIGEELFALGFNLDFAPVLDVDSNPANPVIGDRAFSDDPDRVAACGVAFIEALESMGVAACGKHFPGHGDASADSHEDLPVIAADMDTLLLREIKPFEAAIKAGLRMIMTAHCVYQALDKELPATLSKAAISGLLRGRLGFEGVVISDDLGMKAIAEHFDQCDVFKLGLEAGVDLFLHCGPRNEGVPDRLRQLVSGGVISLALVEEAARRVEAFRCAIGRAAGIGRLFAHQHRSA